LFSLNKPLPLTASHKPRLDLGKADWTKFQNYLAGRSLKYSDLFSENLTADELNSRLTKDILNAAEIAIPLVPSRTGKELPLEIINLIKQKRVMAKNLKASSNVNLRKSYNKLSSEIRRKITDYKDKAWETFLEKHGNHPVMTKPFWKEINKAKSQKASNIFPNLKIGQESAINDKQKANLFASILKQTFSSSFQETDFDLDHKAREEKSVEETNLRGHVRFTMFEINKVIAKLKPSYSPGDDPIGNIFLEKLPHSFLEILLRLCNLAYSSGLPKGWKMAKITMIPKTLGKSNDPGDYRPISMTSCLGKLAERMVKTRLYSYLEYNKLLVIQQSGFRN